MNCSKCGKRTGQVMFDDLTNMTEGRALCDECIKRGARFVDTGAIYQGFIVDAIDPAQVTQQVNPDISCDFCNKPDPVWLYTLDVEDLEIKGRSVSLGDRWATCDLCAVEVENNSPLGTVMNLGVTGNVTRFLEIHTYIMYGLSNKRPYVRSNEDGVLKFV